MKTRITVFTVCLVVLVGFSGWLSAVSAESIGARLAGQILLQVEQNGEAWYVYPNSLERYYLGRPSDAFDVMRALGLGIAHAELAGYQASGFPERLAGQILLDVEQNGEAYYIYPDDLLGYYLGRPADAFNVMRELGLGISDADLAQVSVSVGSSLPEGFAGPVAGGSALVSIPDSNQTACYDATGAIDCPSSGNWFGQDAQYAGVQPNYTVNGNGTVTDNVTGLMWQQDPGAKVDYADAVAGAAGFSLAGYTDWRLPTIKELYSLMQFSGQDISAESTDTTGVTPFIEDSVFDFAYGDVNAGDRIIDSQWATSNVYVAEVMGGQECFFGVNFADGRIKCYPTRTGKGYYTIYVRGGGGNYGQNDFADNGDGTVTDRMTDLTWMQQDNGSGVLWDDALAYCEGLSLGGHTDWRLPNAKELQYLVDYTRSPDTTGSAAIDPVFVSSEITNEAGTKDWPFYWTSTTHVSHPSHGGQGAYISFGRALGNMSQFGGWVDVHGAGAQRSDPKSGVPADRVDGWGPQGDAVRGL
jgi:hypothetical protein